MGDPEAWGEAASKYEIHEETFSYFRKQKELGAKPYSEQTPEEMRGLSLRRSEIFAGHVDFEGSEKEVIVPCEGNQGRVLPILWFLFLFTYFFILFSSPDPQNRRPSSIFYSGRVIKRMIVATQ